MITGIGSVHLSQVRDAHAVAAPLTEENDHDDANMFGG